MECYNPPMKAGSDRTVVRFDHVSKQFVIRKERPRSFQDLFFNVFRFRHLSQPDPYWALEDINFQLKSGEVVGIIGANGAGKSTLLKLMSRIIQPTSGTIEVDGRLGALLELGAGFHPDLTGQENIYLNGSILGLSRNDLEKKLAAIIEFSELGRFIHVPVKHYSSGMYVRLGFSIAVHTEPEILLIDEVLAVGDARFQRKCLDRIAQLRRSRVSIILVSHDLTTVQSLCDRAVFLENGRIVAEGRPDQVVMTYLNLVAAEEKAESGVALAELPQGHRWGTGRMQITKVELCNSDGNPSYVYTTGCAMEIRMYYHAEEPIEDPIFGVAIHHQNGTLICGPNTGFDRLSIPSVHGAGLVSYRIPSLPLLEGTYDVTVTVHHRADTELYDGHQRAYPFRVYPGKTTERYGLVTVSGEWEIRSDLSPILPKEGGTGDCAPL